MTSHIKSKSSKKLVKSRKKLKCDLILIAQVRGQPYKTKGGMIEQAKIDP